jgi:Outer membrane protein beta-barrel domain
MGRGFFPGIIAIAAISWCGTILPANAGPPEQQSPWDKAFCSALQEGYAFRGITQPRCIKVYAGVEGGVARSNGYFDVNPPFSVIDTGGVWGVNGGVLFGTGTPISIGPQVGWYGGNISGSTFYPTSGFDYSVRTRSIVTLEAEATWRLLRIGSSKETMPTDKIRLAGETHYLPYPKFEGIDLHVSLGAASVKTNVNCSCGTSDSSTTTGFTGAVGIGAPIANTPISLIAQYRYINVPSSNVYIPGRVPISGNINIFTVGMQWAFVTAQTPR